MVKFLETKVGKVCKAAKSGPSGRSLSQFLWHEATSIISTPPWMGQQSIAGLPLASKLLVPIYTSG